jgi:hypothetical protein
MIAKNSNQAAFWAHCISVCLFVVLGGGASLAADPLELEKLLRHSDFSWDVDSTAHFRIYVQPRLYADQNIAVVKDRLEEAHRRARRLLGAEAYEETIHVFYVESRQEMSRLIGREPAGVANAGFHTVVLVYNATWRAFERHEIFHVLHENVWGRGAPPIHWFREGMAVYADGDCGGHSVDMLARHLSVRGELIPLRRLVFRPDDSEELLWAVQSGAFFGFLRQRYGRAKVRELWKLGVGEVELVFGKGLEVLDDEFRLYLHDMPASGRALDWAALMRRGCG